MTPRPTIPRLVRPNKRTASHYPILAVSQEDRVFLTEQGEIHPLENLPAYLPCAPPSMIVTQGAPPLLARLDRVYEDSPAWQWRVSPHKREAHLPNGHRGRRINSTVVHFLGWRHPVNGKPGHYHYPVDPTVFSRRTIHDLIRGDAPRVVKLMEWGLDVRRFCVENNLRVAPTNGGIAGQLLRDPRWFPNDRRKVPRATNARARPTLPGNYYKLMCDEGSPHAATYLDMKSAHHNIAARLTFPDPDTLRAKGLYHVTDVSDVTDSGNRAWLKIGTRGYEHVMRMHGLLYVHLTVPHIKATQFPPPYMERPGRRMAWVYTNELPLIRELGGVIDWITAALVSPHTATGLNQYARWAIGQLDQATEDRRRWVKSTLLATYGILAARPRVHEFGFRHANGGTPRRYPAGSGMLQATAMISDTEQEVPTANVIYRGMIEAEQRVMSLAMARDLQSRGIPVLAVYADSVFVEGGHQLPILPEPWLVEQELDNLQFLNPTSFISAQLVKLPGLPREGTNRLRIMAGREARIQAMRAASVRGD